MAHRTITTTRMLSRLAGILASRPLFQGSLPGLGAIASICHVHQVCHCAHCQLCRRSCRPPPRERLQFPRTRSCVTRSVQLAKLVWCHLPHCSCYIDTACMPASQESSLTGLSLKDPFQDWGLLAALPVGQLCHGMSLRVVLQELLATTKGKDPVSQDFRQCRTVCRVFSADRKRKSCCAHIVLLQGACTCETIIEGSLPGLGFAAPASESRVQGL